MHQRKANVSSRDAFFLFCWRKWRVALIYVHTLWVITGENGPLFSETWGTERGRPVWAEARLWFHGRTTSCLLAPESSRVMKGNSNLLFTEQKCSELGRVWFAFSYLIMVIKYDYAWCGMQYEAMSGDVHGWYLRACFFSLRSSRTKRSAQKNRNWEVYGSTEHQWLTLHPTISAYIHTLTYQDSDVCFVMSFWVFMLLLKLISLQQKVSFFRFRGWALYLRAPSRRPSHLLAPMIPVCTTQPPPLKTPENLRQKSPVLSLKQVSG